MEENEAMNSAEYRQTLIPAYAPMHKPNKPTPYTLARADLVFACAAFVLTLILVIGGLWGGFYAGFTAAYLLLFIGCSWYLFPKDSRFGSFENICGILSLALSAVCFVTSGLLVRFCAVCMTGLLSVVWFSSLGGKPILPGELGLAHRVLRQGWQSVMRMPHAVRSLFSSDNHHVKTATKVLLGLLCASPVLCAVIALLIRSDAAFEGLMQHLFLDAGKSAAQIVVTACIFPFLLSFCYSIKKDRDEPYADKPYAGIDTVFLAAFLGVLVVCYLVYLFSQLAYFFSAFSGILPENYTFSYADYARRGFFELCGIAGINLAVLYAILLLSKKKQGKMPGVLCALSIFTDLFTLLLIATAIAKMILYIRRYGVTVLRIGTSAFMIFMAVVFITLLLRFFLPKVRVLPVAVIAASVVVLVLGIGNIHAFAAWYNYTAYERGTLKTIDTAYLRELGDEGIPYLIRLTACDDPQIHNLACGELCIAVEERYNGESMETVQSDEIYYYLVPNERSFGRLSQTAIPRYKAYAALDKLLQEQPDFLKKHAKDRQEAVQEDEYDW